MTQWRLVQRQRYKQAYYHATTFSLTFFLNTLLQLLKKCCIICVIDGGIHLFKINHNYSFIIPKDHHSHYLFFCWRTLNFHGGGSSQFFAGDGFQYKTLKATLLLNRRNVFSNPSCIDLMLIQMIMEDSANNDIRKLDPICHILDLVPNIPLAFLVIW